MKKQADKEYDGSTPLKSILQESFVTNLLANLNQTDAYRKAGYKSKAPEVCAIQLLRNIKVIARLKYLRNELAKKTGVTAEMVIEELKRVGFSNIQDYIEEDNSVTDLSKIPRVVAAAVESVQTDIRHDSGDSDGYTEKVKFKLHSKIAALDKLCLHLGLFERDNEQRTPKTLIVFQDAGGQKLVSNG